MYAQRRVVPGQRGEGREAHLAGAQAAQRVELRLQLAQGQPAGGWSAAHDGGQRARYQLLLVLREQPLRDDSGVTTLYYNADEPFGRRGGGGVQGTSCPVKMYEKDKNITRFLVTSFTLRNW